MTQPGNWHQDMARLAQRQDQLERQQRETSTRIDALKWDVDGRLDSLRTDLDWNSRDGDRRMKSLERFRDYIEKLIMYGIVIGCVIALAISLVIALVDARDERRESEQPQERPLPTIRSIPGDRVSEDSDLPRLQTA